MYTTSNNGSIIGFLDTLSDALTLEERDIRKMVHNGGIHIDYEHEGENYA